MRTYTCNIIMARNWRVTLEGCDCARARARHFLSLSRTYKTVGLAAQEMKICGVEEAHMNDQTGVCAAYAYLAYMETRLDEEAEGPPAASSPPPPLLPAVAAAFPHSPRLPLASSPDSPRRGARSKQQQRSGGWCGGESWAAGVGRRRRLDFLSRLPPEISVYILRLLHPRHLCR